MFGSVSGDTEPCGIGDVAQVTGCVEGTLGGVHWGSKSNDRGMEE